MGWQFTAGHFIAAKMFKDRLRRDQTQCANGFLGVIVVFQQHFRGYVPCEKGAQTRALDVVLELRHGDGAHDRVHTADAVFGYHIVGASLLVVCVLVHLTGTSIVGDHRSETFFQTEQHTGTAGQSVGAVLDHR